MTSKSTITCFIILLISFCITAGFIANIATVKEPNFSSEENTNASLNDASRTGNESGIYYIEEDAFWSNYYPGGEGSISASATNPRIGKNSIKIISQGSGYSGIAKEFSGSPFNLSEKRLSMYVKSSNMSRVKEAQLILANDGRVLSDSYVFNIRKHLPANESLNGQWIKFDISPSNFEVCGDPDGTNISLILLRIKGSGADLSMDGFGYSPLPRENRAPASVGFDYQFGEMHDGDYDYFFYEENRVAPEAFEEGEHVPSPARMLENKTSQNKTFPRENKTVPGPEFPAKPAIAQNVSNATSTAPHKHYHAHHRGDEEKQNRARIVRPSDRMEARFNIVSPRGAVYDNNVTFYATSNLTTEEAKHLAMRYEWNISKDEVFYVRVVGNNKTVHLSNGSYTATLTIKDHFGRTEVVGRNFTVGTLIPQSALPVPESVSPTVEGGTGNIWQASVGLEFNTSNWSLSNFHVGSASWIRAEDVNAARWQAYKNGEDLRREYLLKTPGEKKIAYVLTVVHGDGGKEISGDIISAG